MGLTVDHVVPRSLGGGDELANLRPAHSSCNKSRQARPVSAWRPPRVVVVASGWPGLGP